MGQVCPASAPSQQYAPTNCQGVSTNVTNEKNKIQTSQPCVESRLISRGASCTQDDIRRSLRKEKEMHITSPRSTDTPESNKDDERLHSRHRHSSRSLQNQSFERHRTAGQDSMRMKASKDEERGGKRTSKHHRHKEQDDALKVVRDQFEEFQRTRHQETQGGHQYHRTHVLHQKGTKLQVESQNIVKQQIQTKEHHQHYHHHHHRKMDRVENEQANTEVNRQDRQKSKRSSHGEYSSQNEHNAKISERRIHVPNNSQSARSSQKSHKERSNQMEAVSPRSSLKEQQTKKNEGKDKNTKEGRKKSQRMRKLEDPVYSLPPLMK